MRRAKAGAAHVIGLRRLYCNRNGVFLMVDVPASDVEPKKAELILKGWPSQDDILVNTKSQEDVHHSAARDDKL